MRSLTNAGGEGGSSDIVLSVNELELVAQCDERVQTGKGLYCSLFVELNWVFVPENAEKRPMFYMACPDCKRKVIDDGRGF